MMMVGRTMTGAAPVLFFLKEKTQQNGFKKALKQMSGDLDLPQVCPLSLNENQKVMVGLVMHTLFNFVENTEYYHPQRLVVSGSAGTGKSCHKVSPEVSAASFSSQ